MGRLGKVALFGFALCACGGTASVPSSLVAPGDARIVITAPAGSASPAPPVRLGPTPLPQIAGARVPGGAPSSSEPRCAVSDVLVTATSDQSSYVAGQTVQLSTTVHNVSATRCSGVDIATFIVTDSMGRVTTFPWAVPPGIYLFYDDSLAPGQEMVYEFSWDQSVCNRTGPCTRVPPGSYTATLIWSVGRATTLPFNLQPVPATPGPSATPTPLLP